MHVLIQTPLDISGESGGQTVLPEMQNGGAPRIELMFGHFRQLGAAPRVTNPRRRQRVQPCCRCAAPRPGCARLRRAVTIHVLQLCRRNQRLGCGSCQTRTPFLCSDAAFALLTVQPFE
jgi:hypothetical protein